MKKFLGVWIMLIFGFTLSACEGTDINVVSIANLSEREDAILSATTNHSQVFDFKTDESYKKLTVMIEKYEFGKLTGTIHEITGEINKEGMIIFTSSNDKVSKFTIIISDNGGYISGESKETLNKNVFSVYNNAFHEKTKISSNMVIASIIQSTGTIVEGLPEDLDYTDEQSMDVIKKYEVVYLVKCEFKK